MRQYFVFLVLLVFAPATIAANLEKALEAYDFEEYENAFLWLKPWANDGEPEAQYRLGLLYENGYGVDVNIKNALKWYRQAADQGHRQAKRRLENLRKSTTVDAGNESVATQWYQDLADSGDSEAQYNLGFMYESGWSVPVDSAEAAHWYEKAAEKNITEAQFRLGLLYMIGEGVAKSEIQGEHWVRLAAKSKHQLAAMIRDDLLEADDLVRLNIKLDEIISRVRKLSAKDHKKAQAAIRETVKLAENKVKKEQKKKKERLAKIQSITSAASQTKFSESDLLGPGGRKTLRWYQYKAENGDAEAQFRLGELYEAGTETAKNLKQAANWYSLAAEQGYTQAQYYMGMWYANGIVVTQNEELAKIYLTAAANKDHDKADVFLSKTQAGRLVDNSESIAVWWLKQHAGRGSAEAKYRLAHLYENGRGIVQDKSTARRLYELAAKQGNVDALKKSSRLGLTPASSERGLKQAAAKARVQEGGETQLENEEEGQSLLWYLTISLLLLAPILGFILVLRGGKRKEYHI